jgi:hypothetical protein
VLGEGGVVGYGVEGWWVEFGEGGMGVLAVETFLESINPVYGMLGSD